MISHNGLPLTSRILWRYDATGAAELPYAAPPRVSVPTP
jgi:hypothetical protein